MGIFPGQAKLQVVGDIQTVVEGLPEKIPLKEPSLDPFTFALGVGLFSHPELLGEVIVLNHRASGLFAMREGELQTEHRQHALQTTFLAGIEVICPPQQLLFFEHQTIDRLFEQLRSRYPDGCAVVGDCLIETFEGRYVKELSPYAEGLAHDWGYYCVEPSSVKMQYVHLFGFVFTPSMHKKQGVAHILYADELSHAHVGFTQDHVLPKNYEQMLTNCSTFLPQEVHHLHTRSCLKQGAFAIFELT